MAGNGYYGATAQAEKNIRHKDGSALNTLAHVIQKPNRARILRYTGYAII
nr:MAG TPA: hypothetical protein [Caudoviricetes sp.]